MEQRAVGDRAGEVGGEAAAGGEAAVDGEDAAVVVEADLVLVEEVVALAGRDHVVVAVGADLDGAVPSFLAATAATAAKRFGWVSLPPKPPPMRRTMMVTAFDGTPRTWATMCCTSDGCWVEE